jgi:molybdenum cofactor synthesis domain-containing protein
MSYVELISIGNELLIGKITNSNASWLASRITRAGGVVKRIIVVPDNLEEIVSSIKESIDRGARGIITTGGLGPTFDDMTLKGIAKCFGLEMNVNEEALEWIRNKYKEKGWELTPPRIKMAIFPQGAKPLRNPVGTAPALYLEVGGSRIYALPGVPKEMDAIYDQSVDPEIRKLSSNLPFAESLLQIKGVFESSLAPVIDEVMKDNPGVYIKSHPSGDEAGHSTIHLHFTCNAATEDRAKGIINKAAAEMARTVKEKFGVMAENSDF